MKNLLKNNFFYIQKKSEMKILETVKTFIQEIDATVFLCYKETSIAYMQLKLLLLFIV